MKKKKMMPWLLRQWNCQNSVLKHQKMEDSVPVVSSNHSYSSRNAINSEYHDRYNSEETATIEEILENYVENKLEIEKYLKEKYGECESDSSPVVSFLNGEVMTVLRDGMCQMLQKVKEDDSFYKPKSTLNGLDFLSEYLHNMNPLHPERKSNWTYIFDLQWVNSFLEISPRPFYSLSLIWSKEKAAKKIQAYWRGYCDRRENEIQEIRQFWKNLKETKEPKKGSTELSYDGEMYGRW